MFSQLILISETISRRSFNCYSKVMSLMLLALFFNQVFSKSHLLPHPRPISHPVYRQRTPPAAQAISSLVYRQRWPPAPRPVSHLVYPRIRPIVPRPRVHPVIRLPAPSLYYIRPVRPHQPYIARRPGTHQLTPYTGQQQNRHRYHRSPPPVRGQPTFGPPYTSLHYSPNIRPLESLLDLYHSHHFNSSAFLKYSPQYPGPCTWQRSKAACTFTSLCHLAGGSLSENCDGNVTCCVLKDQSKNGSPVSLLLKSASTPDISKPVKATKVKPPVVLGKTSVTTTATTASNTIESCGRAMKPLPRIIGGKDAVYGEFPWQVHISIAGHQCGGALVNHNHVITAGHCVFNIPAHRLSVIIGAHDIEDPRFQPQQPQYFSVSQVTLHPQFNFSASNPDRFDLAILRLNKSAVYSSNISPICLPRDDTPLEGMSGLVTGWGKIDTNLANRKGTRLLQKVDVPIVENKVCEEWHASQGINIKIFDEMFCAGYEEGRKDACIGDSGGPLALNLDGRWTLVGVTSAGYGCAQPRQPGIYHRIPVTVDWIRRNIAT